MSTTIDERVVEMRFDNQHFENNVSTTMSTLDKLKAKLNFTGASKGLDNVSKAAKNVDMGALTNGVETARLSFSALDVFAVNALSRISQAAMTAGKRIVKSLTIDPVMSGFEEYETKMGSIQTILANTEHQGTTLDDVTAALEKLNLYADKTIYNFQQMTRNIGTFTAAGVDLETSVKSIQGIANLAAVSGSTSQQASTAMYQLSQALASGTVKLMDWNSVVNAGMGGKVFQNALIRTAAALDKSSDNIDAWKKKHIDAFGSFRDSLTSSGWLTTEVLTKTLEQFTMAAEEGSDEWNEFKKSLMADGYTEKQAEEILKMANTATDAATKVKTFTQLMDTLKESAQSGWAQTWELIVGDFEEAKEFFTGLSNIFGDIIGKSAERRNGLLSGALDSNWDKLIKKISDAGIETEKFEESIRKIVGDDKLDGLIDEFGSLEKAVKSGAISSDILKKAIEGIFEVSKYDFSDITRNLSYGFVGKDVEKVQKALKDLGYKLAEGVGYDGIWGPLTESAVREFQKANGLIVDGIVGPETLAALEKAGGKIEATAEDVEGLKASCADLIDVITSTSGRELLLDSLMNIIKAIQRPLSAVGEAFREIFSLSPDQLYNALEKINNFTKKLVPKGILDTDSWDTLTKRISKLGIDTPKFLGKLEETLKKHGVNVDDLKKKYGGLAKAFEDGAISMDIVKEALLSIDGITESLLIGGETVDKVRRTFKGLFAVFDIIATIVSGPVKIAFNVVTKFLEKLGLSVLDITAKIGDSIVAFRDKLDGVIDTVTDFIVDNVGEWIKGLKETEFFKTVVGWFEDGSEAISKAVQAISDKIKELDGTKIMGYLSILGSFISKAAASLKDSKVVGFIVDTVCGAFERLKNLFSGFKLPEFNLDNMRIFTKLASAMEGASGLGGALMGAVKWLKNQTIYKAKTALENLFGIKWDMIKASAMDKFVTFWQTTGDKIKKAFAKVGEVFKAIAEFMFGTEDVNLPAILDVANKFLGLVTLIKALGFLETLSSPLDNVTDAIDNLAGKLKWQAVGAAFQSMALALGTLTLCIIILANMPDMERALTAAYMLGGLLVAMGIIIAVLTGLSVKLKTKDALDVVGIALSLTLLIGAIFLLTQTVKMIDGMTLKDPVGTVLSLVAMILALWAGIKVVASAGSSSFSSVAAVLTLVAALKMILDVIDTYDQHDWTGQGDAILRVAGMLVLLSTAINIASRGLKQNAGGAGGLALLLLVMVGSLKMLVGAIEDFAEIPTGDLVKGGAVIAAVLTMMSTMVYVMGKANQGTILAKGTKLANNYAGLAAALLTVIAAIWILGKMALNERDTLIHGGFAVAQILGLFTAMLSVVGSSCSGLKMGAVISMLVLIGVLIAEMAVIIHCLKDIPWQQSLGTAVALGTLLLALGVCVRIITEIAGNRLPYKIMDHLATMLVIAGAVALLAIVLKKIDFNSSWSSITALSALLVVISGVMAACALIGKIDGVSFGSTASMVGAIALLSAIVLELGIFLALIKAMNVGNMIPEVISISILLAALTGVMAACSLLSPVGAAGQQAMFGAIGAIAALGFVVLELGIILSLIKAMSIGNMLPEVLTLSVMLLALTGVMAACALVGTVGNLAWPSMLVAVLAIAALGAVVLELGWFLSLMKEWGIGSMLPEVKTLSVLLLNLSVVLGILAVVGAFAGAAIAGASLLFVFVTGLVAALGLLGKTFELFPNLSSTIDVAIEALEKIAYGLGSIVSAFGAGMMSSLSDIATQIGDFLTAVGDIDLENVAGVKLLCDMMSTLVGATFWDGINDWLWGEQSLSGFGENMVAFAKSIKEVAGALNELTDEDVAAVTRGATAGQALADLNNSLPRQGGWLQDVIGEKDLEDFGKKACAFADLLIEYSNKVTGQSIDAEAIKTSAEAGSAIADLNNAIPRDDGMLQDITGAKDLSDWGQKLVAFGNCLVAYSNTVTGKSLDADAIKASAKAAGALAELNGNLPSQNGLYQAIAGEKDLGLFGTQLVTFAGGIVAYANAASEISEDKITAIENSGTAIEKLIEVTGLIPTSGGWWAGIAGESDGESFGYGLIAMAKGIVDYCNAAATIGEDDITAITNSGTAITAIGTIMDLVPSEDKAVKAEILKAIAANLASAALSMNQITIGEYDYSGLTNLETAVSDLSTTMTDIETSSLFVKAQQLLSAILSMVSCATNLVGMNGYNYAGIDTFKAAVESLAETKIDEAITAFSGKGGQLAAAVSGFTVAMQNAISQGGVALKGVMTSLIDGVVAAADGKKSDFLKVGGNYVTQMKTGVEDSIGDAEDAGKVMGDSAATGAREGYDGAYSAGSYLVDGFAAGISANTFKAAAAAIAMANAAEAAARAALGINSPSKVFKEIGMGIPEGFILGVEKLGGSVDKTILHMTDGAIYSVGNTIAKLASIISTDIDSQPTIRPVLDLTDVRAGASSIGNLFDTKSQVGVMANINSIGGMMSRYGQNGSNGEVVAAIDKLRKELGNVGNTTYSINGVTYDDGSNVATAVREIVRAARTERRV